MNKFFLIAGLFFCFACGRNSSHFTYLDLSKEVQAWHFQEWIIGEKGGRRDTISTIKLNLLNNRSQIDLKPGVSLGVGTTVSMQGRSYVLNVLYLSLDKSEMLDSFVVTRSGTRFQNANFNSRGNGSTVDANGQFAADGDSHLIVFQDLLERRRTELVQKVVAESTGYTNINIVSVLSDVRGLKISAFE